MAKAHELLALLHERWLLVEGQRQNDPQRLQIACQALGTALTFQGGDPVAGQAYDVHLILIAYGRHSDRVKGFGFGRR
jgi:hypothetical protein